MRWSSAFPPAATYRSCAANAFRREDTDFFDAYQKELRAMKASGEYVKIANDWGFEIPPELLTIDATKACELVSASK